MQLDHFSRLVADEIFLHFPGWQAHARIDLGSGEPGFLAFELPPPAGADLVRPLLVTTRDKRIRVQLDHYAGDFGRFTSSEERPDCLTGLRRVMAEEIMIVSWWSGAALCGAAWSRPEILPAAPAACRPYDRTRSRS